MEQSQNDELETKLISFKLEYKDQNIENLPSFKKWNEEAKKKIKEINKKNIRARRTSIISPGVITLTISFCNNCNSYSFCTVESDLSLIKCNNCHKKICPGCNRANSGICLKGFIKLIYIRMINGRSFLSSSNIVFNIFFIFIFLIFAPFHIGCISSIIGLLPHPKIRSNKNIISDIEKDKANDDDKKKIFFGYFLIFYCFFRGLLMFPYIITFFPFLLLILLPAIFSKKYFYRVMIVYWAALIPGKYSFENVQDL
jgi:hypothetical protein